MNKLYLLLLVVATSFCTYMYVQRANLNYNEQGRYFSAESGVVYHKQSKEVYGV